MKVLLAFALFSLAVAAPQLQLSQEWQRWKLEHGKGYESDREELERHLIWQSNVKYIEAHNQNAHILGFTLKMNHFGDLSDVEFEELYLSKIHSSHNENYTITKLFDPTGYGGDLPESIDWRNKGAVSSVKNQGQCGASYAFSAMGALEGAWALAHGKLTPLSEQNVIDCSISYGNHGCNGGNMYNAYRYVVANDGVDTQSSYPFQGRQSSCSYSKSNSGARMSSFISIASGSESNLQMAVAYVGPVAVAVDADNKAFRYYYQGVYSSSRCSSTDLNHAMVITGYGSTGGTDYWLVKNSWGTNWGMSGYILMTRNNYNQCGIASDASYPTL